MAQKRASDALVAIPDMKRSRNELVAVTNRDKALLEVVRNVPYIEQSIENCNIFKSYLYSFNRA